jgi:hypothetical protein
MRARVRITAIPGTGGGGGGGGGGDPAPDYSINYSLESTKEEVSTDHEYSYTSDYSTKWDGENQKLDLLPGRDVYFRLKTDWSKNQTLYVPDRPDAPSFSIDYPNERTSQTVADTYEYSTSSDMSGAVTGSDNYPDVVPGNSLYFRQKSTFSSFRSEIQELQAQGRPSAPSFTIDYINERTNELISDAYAYSGSSDMSGAVTGSNNHADISPGNSLYIRGLATPSSFASAIQQLQAPGRPAAPAYMVDFMNETTSTAVSSADEYADNLGMSGAVSGGDAVLALTPGTDMYFRTKAAGSAFSSEVQTLVVPNRPAKPGFTIDFSNETTAEAVSSEYSYASSADMSGAMTGTGSQVAVLPGSQLHIRKNASGSTFVSEVQSIILPNRPAAPVLGIDYASETTAENVSADMEYSQSASFGTSTPGSGEKLPLTPGENLFIRMLATADNFSSETLELTVPSRPVISSDEPATTDKESFFISVTFAQAASNLTLGGITASNSALDGLQLIASQENSAIYMASVSPVTAGSVNLLVNANAVTEGNFQSEAFDITYQPNTTGIGTSGSEEGLTLYPNPTTGVIRITSSLLGQSNVTLELYSLTGKLLYSEKPAKDKLELLLDMSHLDQSIYLLKLATPASSMTRKVILQGN